MLRRLGIRGKVLAALSVPVLVLTLLAGLISWQSIQEAQTARTVTTLLNALQESREVVTALQAERRAALPYVSASTDENRPAGLPTASDLRPEVDSSREVTTDSIYQFNQMVASVDFDSLDPLLAAAVRDMRSGLEGLAGVRGRMDAQNVPMSAINTNYTGVIDDVVSFPENIADQLDDRRLAGIIAANAELTSLNEDYNQEQSLGSEVLDGAREPAQFLSLAQLFPASKIAHQQTSNTIRALGLGDAVLLPPLGASFNGFQSYDSYRTLMSTGNTQNFDFIDAAAWTVAASAEIESFEPVATELRQAASSRASAVAAAALRTSAVTIGGAAAALILSVLAALAIARQIVNPLRRLTEAAAMVRDELPRLVEQVAIPGQGPDLTLTHIPVVSRDEIGLLAAAFNEVNSTTIQVAQEQAALRGSIAEMFVNVARRDQVLLNRQLSFIDALERSEEDPRTLADLFRLDHLATRMRRNAESLLVLAGIDTGRRLRETLPLSDVIRTASSEIEHYERVQLDLPVDPMMLGHTALPAAHMMAELLENATVFSEPGTPVHVSTGIDEDDVIITILDQGLGMTPDELAEVNLKIRKTSAGDVLGSQRLGMFVVGRIAARLGASADLTAGPDGRGTLVTIRMPRVLFVDPHSIPLTPPTAPAARVETFVLPEEAAEVVHDTAFAPIPAGVQDVAAGALGSAENPAEAVDLESLTDGATGRGLPRRRSRGADVEAPAPSLLQRDEDDAAAAPSIPLAPRAEALAGAAGVVSPAGGVWAPQVVESAPLVSRRDGDADAKSVPSRTGAGGGTELPSRPAAAPSGLPTRQPAGPVASSASPTTTPIAEPEGRAAMFSGFRSRRAELAAAAIHVETGDARDDLPAGREGADGSERLAAAAGAAAFFGRGATHETPAEPEAPAPMVIPTLMDDAAAYGEPDFGGADFGDMHESQAPAAAEHVTGPVASGPFGPEGVVPQPHRPQAFEPVAQAVAPVAEPFQPPVQPPFQPAAAPVQPADDPAAIQAVLPATRRSPRHALPFDESEGQRPWSPATPAHAASWPPPELTVAPQAAVWPPSQPIPTVEPAWAPTFPVEPVQPVTWDVDQVQPWVAQAPQTGQVPQEPVLWAPDAPSAVADEVDAAWPPAPIVVPVDAAPGAVAPQLAAPGGQWLAEPVAAPDFSELVQGSSQAAAPTAKPRRGLFGRKRGKRDAAAAAEPVVEPVVAPVEPSYVEPPLGFPSVAPVRQSAWNTTDIGVHALPEPVAPVFEPQATEVPAATWQTPPEPAPQAPAPAEPVWEPQTAWTAPPAQAPVIPASVVPPVQTEAWAPTPAWPAKAPAAPVPARRPEPAAAASIVPSPHSPFRTSFTPQPSSGSFDDEVTSMLAQRADIAQQALAELSQLSSYRPKAVSGDAQTTLVRRTPNAIPAAPAIETRSPVQRTERDANQVRSLLSSFQSGTSRGRQASDATGLGSAGESHQATGDNGESRAGHEDGSDVGHGEPVTTPDTDLTQRSTSW